MMETLRCGLLGKKLGHSRSPEIHRLLGDYEYRLYEMDETDLESFLRKGTWRGMNVTIPYKKAVVPFLDSLSPVAASLGSVNTILRLGDGTLFGDNTDVYGFEAMVRRFEFDLAGRKSLILGSGGASASVREALRRLGAESAVISRSGPFHYGNLYLQKDAEYVVNTTPVGMWPNVDDAPLDLRELPSCRGVIDLIYNPPETRLTAQAKAMGMRCCTGLYMLVAQAWRAAELFLDQNIPESRVEAIYQEVRQK